MSSKSRPVGSVAAGAPATGPQTSTAPKPTTGEGSSVKARSPFEILAKPNKIAVPKSAPFVAEESDANAWGIPTCIRYLKEVVELPQYEGIFTRFEVNGFAFLCLAKDVIPQLNISNNFHSAKIALHADKLRQKVFEKAAVSLPAKIEDWDVVHVAAWLAIHMGLSAKGLKALRNGLDGMKLLEMSEDQLQIFLNTTLDDDLSSKLHSLIETGRYGSTQIEGYLGSIDEDGRAPVKKKKKKKTLMSERLRDQGQENEADNEPAPPSYDAAEEKPTAVIPIKREGRTIAPVNVGQKMDAAHPQILLEKKSSKSSLNKTVTFQSPEKLNPEPRKVLSASAPQPTTTVTDSDDSSVKGAGSEKSDSESEAEDAPEYTPTGEAKQIERSEKASAGVNVDRRKDVSSSVQRAQREHSAHLTEVIGHVVASNKATVGALQQMILQLSEERRHADEELMRARAQSLDSTIALGLLKRDKEDSLNKIETMIRGLQGGGLASDARNKLPVAPSKAAESPPRDSWDATSESLLVLPEPVQAVRESVIEEIRQPYRTYVDTSTPKQLFLGRDYNASMEDTMLQEAIKEKRHWLQCLDTYTNMEPVGTEYNESRMILSETAVVWIKVGSQMLRDSTKDLNAPGALPREVQRCLLGLRQCVSTALRSRKPSIHDPGSPTRPKAGGKTTDALTQENVSELSVGMVYALAFVRKVMSKHPSRADTMNLSFLLRKARHGDLPLSELSREDLRSLLEDFLNIDFSKWHKLEAVCQLLDPDRNGFVDLPSVLRSFHSLCPLLESGHDKLTAQRLSLVLLTLACEDLASRKVDLNRALSDVITERSGEVSSFKAFLRSEAFTGKKTKAEAESSDIARMEDIEIIADLLYEFTAHFFIRGSGKGQNLLELSLPHWTVKVEMSPSPRKPRRSNQTAAESSIDMMEYLATHLRQVCTEVARSFRIYHSDSDQSVRRPVLTSVATLFATYMCFRRSILLRSSSPDSILARFINHGPADTARSDGSHRSALLLPQQVLVMAEGIEQHVLGVLGRDRATAALSKADAMTPEDFELVMAQLIGIPIPTGWGQSVGLALSACQLDVDSYLLEVTGPGLVRSPRVVPTAQQRLDTRSVSRLNRTGGSGRYTRALTSADDTAYAVTKIASSSRPLVARNSAKFMPETEIKDSLRLLNGEALSLKANLDHLIKLREAAALIKAAGIAPEGFKDDRNAVLNNTIAICKRLEADKVTAASENPPAVLYETREALMAGLLPDPLGALQIEVEAAMALVDRLQTARTDALRLCGSVVATLR